MDLIDMVTARQAAAVIGISPDRVRQLCQAGDLAGQHWQGRWVIQVAEVARFAAIPIEPNRRGRPRGSVGTNPPQRRRRSIAQAAFRAGIPAKDTAGPSAPQTRNQGRVPETKVSIES